MSSALSKYSKLGGGKIQFPIRKSVVTVECARQSLTHMRISGDTLSPPLPLVSPGRALEHTTTRPSAGRIVQVDQTGL